MTDQLDYFFADVSTEQKRDEVESALVQEARQEYTKARLRHSTVKLMMTEMEARVNKALVAVRDAEIARLRLHAA